MKGAVNHSNDTNGNSLFIGEEGKNAIKVNAPIVIIGAVSPIARAKPIMIPVKIPGAEYGNK